MPVLGFPLGYVLSLGFLFVLRAFAGQNESRTAELNAVDLQRKAESALDRVQQNDVGADISDVLPS